MQFEVFYGSENDTAQSTLGWPASGSFAINTYDWEDLAPIIPLDQLPSLPTTGLLNNTVYDMPVVDSTSVNATVNATTIHANCGLLSNLSPDPDLGLNATIPSLGPVSISIIPTICEFCGCF